MDFETDIHPYHCCHKKLQETGIKCQNQQVQVKKKLCITIKYVHIILPYKSKNLRHINKYTVKESTYTRGKKKVKN